MGQSGGDVVARALLVGEVAGLVAAYRLSPGFGFDQLTGGGGLRSDPLRDNALSDRVAWSTSSVTAQRLRTRREGVDVSWLE